MEPHVCTTPSHTPATSHRRTKSLLPHISPTCLLSSKSLLFCLSLASYRTSNRLSGRMWSTASTTFGIFANPAVSPDRPAQPRPYFPASCLDIPIPMMEGIQTHPSSAAQAKAFTAPGSLSFPGAANELVAPGSNGVNGQQPGSNGQQPVNGNGVTPATPAATPAGNQGPSGITPTLQYVST